MSNTKKRIPLIVLETLQPFVTKRGKYFSVSEPGDFLMLFIDADDTSGFHFIIEGYQVQNSVTQLLIDMKPKNKLTTESGKFWIEASNIETFFGNWVKLLESYDNIKTVYDDPIVKAFEEEYFSEFEIIEDDSDILPFGIKQILLLDKHLEDIEAVLENYPKNGNASDINEIKTDIKVLKNELTKKPKEWVIKKLCNIWGKISKVGIVLIKEVLNESKKQAIIAGLKFLIENGHNLL